MDAIFRAFLKAHVWVYRTTKGKLGGMKGSVVLLTTTGRKSGAERTVPLAAIRDDGRYLVAASAGGDDRNPGWLHNLVANSSVTLQDAAEVTTMHARVADASERPVLWQQFVDRDQRFAKYQERTEREIPVVVVEP